MRRRLWWCVLAASIGGCWSSEPLIDNTFTPEQWERLKLDYKPPQPPDPCADTLPGNACNLAVTFGQQLFFEPALSGKGQVSCVTCHDVGKPSIDRTKDIPGWFADVRVPNNVSLGDTNWTKRNSISVINVGLKQFYAPGKAFAWSGNYATSGEVLELAIKKAMSTNYRAVAQVIRTNLNYLRQYNMLFGPLPPDCGGDPQAECPSDAKTAKNLGIALEAYMRRLVSLDSPFDRWITDQPSTISESAKRGFGVFIGRGMCAECHGLTMFSDYDVHNTGVPQLGDHVGLDAGRADDHGGLAMDPMDAGLFVTPSLRNVARTGPYMHDGAFASLAEVIKFYRDGGVASGFVGQRDPRIQPATSMTDEDAIDLEAFLNSLTGASIPQELRQDLRPTNVCVVANDPNPGTMCGATCVDLVRDPNHCGSCDKICTVNEVCMGSCFPTSMTCPIPLQSCHGACLDFQADPQNCGSCGHACTYPTTACVMGTCQ